MSCLALPTATANLQRRFQRRRMMTFYEKVKDKNRPAKGKQRMHSAEEAEVAEQRKICHDCVGEPFLKSAISASGKRGKCFYCDRTNRTYTIGILADEVERAFADHYARTSTEPDAFQSAMSRDQESDYDWSREGEPVIYAIMDAAKKSRVGCSGHSGITRGEIFRFRFRRCGRRM
jgi:hypothetical protein